MNRHHAAVHAFAGDCSMRCATVGTAAAVHTVFSSLAPYHHQITRSSYSIDAIGPLFLLLCLLLLLLLCAAGDSQRARRQWSP
jgi:hypothetical protein